MTPLQYQKQMRLHEARRLMLVGNADAASAAHHVGYESPSPIQPPNTDACSASHRAATLPNCATITQVDASHYGGNHFLQHRSES